MKPSDCSALQTQMEVDLQKYVKDPNYSTQVIRGHGFRELSLSAVLWKVPELLLSNLAPFLESYLPSLHIHPEAKELLTRFCSKLKFARVDKLQKFEFLFGDQGGKGSWIGVFFRRTSQTECEFYSSVISCAFTLVPDVFVIRESSTDRFGPFSITDQSIYLVERTRGFSRADLSAIMAVCSFVSSAKAITC